MVYSKIFQAQQQRRRLCGCGRSCWWVVSRLTASRSSSVTDCWDSARPGYNSSAQHSTPSSQVHICHLMHRRLPHGRDKSDARHHRNRRMVLDKKQKVFGTCPSSNVRRAILPNFFQKRLKRNTLAKCTVTNKRAEATEVFCPVESNDSSDKGSVSCVGEVQVHSKEGSIEEVRGSLEAVNKSPKHVPIFPERKNSENIKLVTEKDNSEQIKLISDEVEVSVDQGNTETAPVASGECNEKQFEENLKEDPIKETISEQETENQVASTFHTDTDGEIKLSVVEDTSNGQTINSVVASCSSPAAVDRLSAFDSFKKNFKEYCAIQWKFRLLFAMLQERLEELEQGTESTKENGHHPFGALDEGLQQMDENLQRNSSNHRSKDHTGSLQMAAQVKKELCDPRNCDKIVTDENHTDCKPDRVNYVPSKTEITSILADAAANRTLCNPSKCESKDDIQRSPFSLLEGSKSDILHTANTCCIDLEPLENRKHSFVDSLLNKFNLSPPVKQPMASAEGRSDGEGDNDEPKRRSLRDRKRIAARPRYIQSQEEPRKMRLSKVFGQLHKSLNIELESTNSNSSSEFYGFDEGEVVKLDKPSFPGLLPTPIVKKSQPYAPFLSYGTSIGSSESSSIGSETRSDLFREEGLISFGSLPPRLECPQRPNDMVRPRTVAQKRVLLQKENDVRYLMIDNESKIFHFLEKRSKNIDVALDFQRMRELQDQPIPFTRDTWRALAWLRTEKNRYYFQTLTIDNRTVKLTGCRGNHPHRRLTKKNIFSSPVMASGGCRYHFVNNCSCPEFPDNMTLDFLQNTVKHNDEAPSEASKPWRRLKLLPVDQFPSRGDYRTHRSYPRTKPGPLSSKCLPSNLLDEDRHLGPMEVFQMPPVELEVFPKINRPLDGHVKPYLKMIQPHSDITENWARFAVSTLKKQDVPTADAVQAGENEQSFVFRLPYANNQRRMLIRRRLTAHPGTNASTVDIDIARFEKLMAEKLTFRESVDLADPGVVDEDVLICANVLSEMTDSVAIALAEDIFQTDDADVDYTKEDKPLTAECSKSMLAPIKTPSTISSPKPQQTPVPPSTAGSSQLATAVVEDQKEAISATPNQAPSTVVATETNKTNPPADLKLLREMKRLNATIIKNPSQPAGHIVEAPRRQRCDPHYCTLGCICDVLSGLDTVTVTSVLRKQHCGQIDCVFGCNCGYKQERVLEVKTPGGQGPKCEAKSTFNADMKHLHEEVTERLAKEERQFTSTVIVTDNVAVVLPNSESEVRRHKKMPKKYDDYYNDKSVQCLLNGVAIAGKPPATLVSEQGANAKPLSSAERMRHAHVLLNRVPELDDLEPWCMVHEVYRCHCHGKATHGKPFSFTEESIVTMPLKVSAAGAGDGAVPSRATKIVISPVAVAASATATAGRMQRTQSVHTATSSHKKIRIQPPTPIVSEVSPVANLDTRRKRLYSFEKPLVEPDNKRGKATLANSPAATLSFGSRRRERDSSEESYKPPYEKKSTKGKKSKLAEHMFPQRRASVAVRQDPVVPRRTMGPQRRASIAARASLYALQTGLSEFPATPPPPAPTSGKVVRRSEPMGAPDSPSDVRYTVFPKPSKSATGGTGISSIIIKRLPTPASLPPPKPASQTSKPSASLPLPIPNATTPAVNSTEVTENNNSYPKNARKVAERKCTKSAEKPHEGKTPVEQPHNRRVKCMTVAELKTLIVKEHTSAAQSTSAAVQPVDRCVKPQFCYIDLVDSEDNIDNAPQLNNLTDGTKKLIICGNRKTFVENEEFDDVKPPQRFVPYSERTTYIVQIPSQNTIPAEKEVGLLERKKLTRMSIATMPQASASSKREAVVKVVSDVPSTAPQKGFLPTKQLVDQTDRQLVSLMRHINEFLGRSTLSFNAPKHGIMYICRWKVFLRAFVLGQIDVLDVVLRNGLELTVVNSSTFSSWKLSTGSTLKITSARQSTLATVAGGTENQRQTSLLLHMLIQRVDNIKTNQLAVLLYGSTTFWHFCGFLKTKPGRPYMSNSNILLEPSTQASVMVRERLKRYYVKAAGIAKDNVVTARKGTSNEVAVRKSTCNEVTARKGTSNEVIARKGTSNEVTPRKGPTSGQTIRQSSILPVSAQSNVQLVKREPSNASNLAQLLPILQQLTAETHHTNAAAPGKTRWMRLVITNDFSDMYIPSWNCCVSYGRIINAIMNARKQEKPICLQLPFGATDTTESTQILPRLYAIPNQGQTIFLGPYPGNQRTLDIMLCQMVDGKLFTREEFHRTNSINGEGKMRTTGCWIDTAKPVAASTLRDTLAKAEQKEAAAAAARNGKAGGPGTTARSLLKRSLNKPQEREQQTQERVEQMEKDEYVIILDENDDPTDERASTSAALEDVNEAEDMMTRIRAQLLALNEHKEGEEGEPTPTSMQAAQTEPEVEQRRNLLLLVEKTMEQTKEDKRKLASLVQRTGSVCKPRARPSGSSKEPSKKRRSIEDGAAPNPPKVVRLAAPVAGPDQSTSCVEGQSQISSSKSNASVIRRRTPLRMSLPMPGIKQPLYISPKVTQLDDIKPVKSASGKISGVAPTPSASGRRNVRAMSVAVRPTVEKMLPQKPEEEDVVCLDDDDDDDDLVANNRSGAANERLTMMGPPAPAPQSFGNKELNNEQIALLVNQLDSNKTGPQNGYRFNPTTRVLTMKRSLSDSLSKDSLDRLKTYFAAVDSKSATTPVTTTPATVTSPPSKMPNTTQSKITKPKTATPVIFRPETTTSAIATPQTTTPTNTTQATKKSIVAATGPSKQATLVGASGAQAAELTSAFPPVLVTATNAAKKITLPRMKVVPRLSIAQSPGTVATGSTESTCTEANGSLVPVKCLTPAMEAALLMKPHKRGVLKSKINKLGQVEVVRLDREVIIRIKELTGQKQFVSVANLEEAVTLVNEFIQRNTYAFIPFNLVIQWEFVERSTPLTYYEDLTKIINQRCIVTRYGIVDTSKPEQMKEVQTSVPALYEELMLMQLSILCCPKNVYEKEKCYEDDGKVYEKAVAVIDRLMQTERTLAGRKRAIAEILRTNRKTLKELEENRPAGQSNSGNDSQSPPKLPSPPCNQEAVIVIDDD